MKVDRAEVQARVEAGTHTPGDQVYLLNQAADIALVKMMQFAMEKGAPEEIADTVADCLSLIILAAPEDERTEIKDEIMGLYKP